jgi:hypothetical protein
MEKGKETDVTVRRAEGVAAHIEKVSKDNVGLAQDGTSRVPSTAAVCMMMNPASDATSTSE